MLIDWCPQNTFLDLSIKKIWNIIRKYKLREYWENGWWTTYISDRWYKETLNKVKVEKKTFFGWLFLIWPFYSIIIWSHSYKINKIKILALEKLSSSEKINIAFPWNWIDHCYSFLITSNQNSFLSSIFVRCGRQTCIIENWSHLSFSSTWTWLT